MLLVLWIALAHANIAPPPDLAVLCSIQEMCGPEEEGIECTASGTDRKSCDALEADGWDKRCESLMTLDKTWQEVFCRTRSEHRPPRKDPNGALSPSQPSSISPPSRRCATPINSGLFALIVSIMVSTLRRRSH